MSEKELNEMWDDTSLIEAYDKAVSLAYDAVHAKLDANGETADAFKEPKPVANGPTTSKKAKKNRKKWQVGEKCLAKYVGDSEWYEARILDVNRSHNKCMIKFDGYETELECNLGTLKQLPEKDDISNSEVTDRSGSGNESASMDLFQEMSGSVNDLEKQNPETSKKTTKNFPQMIQGLPFAPPPMPPTFLTSNRSKIGENEAMASMLMSWYMSGYHTGYYQALQDAKKPRKN